MSYPTLFSAGTSNKSFAITPGDTSAANYANRARFIYVGGTGDVALVNLDGSVTTYKAVPVGAYLWCASLRVNATGTTATFLVGHQ
jgi:hypothetical protein